MEKTSDPDAASADVLKRVNAADFPFVVWGPSPPFALGSVWAVCPSEEYALAVAAALERSPLIVEATIRENRERIRRALSGGSLG